MRIALALILALATAAPADAGLFCRCHRARVRTCQRPAPILSTYATPQAYATAGASDGTFLGWINATRARSGLGPVAWDAALANDAAINSSRGFGHSYMGHARRQNAGMGDIRTVQAMWMNSGPHASAILDPTIRFVGVATVNGVTTFSAY